MPPPYTPPPQYTPPRAPAPAGSPVYPPPAYPGYPQSDYAAMQHQKRVGRTKTGVLLIAIGFAITWLPFVGLIGGLLIFIGAILAILGRKAFGSRHSLFVVISVVLLIAGFLGSVIAAFVIALQNVSALTLGDFSGFVGVYRGVVIGSLAFGILIGIASAIFVHELENQTGKYLLYAGFAASVVTGALIAVLTLSALDALGPGVTAQDFVAFSSQLPAINLLSGVPSIVFAGAYLMAYSRISRGEIPGPVGPAPPAPAWPAPGSGGYLPPPAAPAAPSAPPSPPPPSPPSGPP